MNTLDRASPSTVPASDPPAEVLRLFHEHGGAIYRFCRSTLRNESDADDVLQETFLKLLQHLTSKGELSNVRSWLFTVAANACHDRGRWRARWLPWSADTDRRAAPLAEEEDDRSGRA